MFTRTAQERVQSVVVVVIMERLPPLLPQVLWFLLLLQMADDQVRVRSIYIYFLALRIWRSQLRLVNREFKQNSRGRRAHVNIWNQADIRAPCSRVRRQLLHISTSWAKTWSIFQEIKSFFLFRKSRWRQLKFSENGNKEWSQSNYQCSEKQGSCRNFFAACWLCRRRPFWLKLPK